MIAGIVLKGWTPYTWFTPFLSYDYILMLQCDIQFVILAERILS